MATSPALRSTALLIARVVVGAIFVAHGLQKILQFTLPGTAQAFNGMGVPAPGVMAPLVAGVELLGGTLLILGLLTPVAGILLALTMAGAALTVHLPAGMFVENGGWELVGALGASALLLAALGAGRFSLDHLIGRGRRTHGTAPEPSAATAPAEQAASVL